MKRPNILLLSLACAGAVCASVPQITDFTVKQDAVSREVTIDYRLAGEPAVVTVDVLTNGTSIGYANLRGFVGDVYHVRPVSAPDTSYRISWRPDKHWPAGGRITDDSVSFKLTAWATNAPPEWLVADLRTTPTVWFYPDRELFPAGPELTNNVYKTDYLVMRKIHAAGKTFVMGQLGSSHASYPQRTVAFSKDYYMAVFALTPGQYFRVVSKNVADEFASNPAMRLPAVTISKTELDAAATAFVERFAGSFAPNFRLPSSAEWEFACRAGTVGGRPFPSEDLDDYVWYQGNSGNALKEVGLKKPNAWMLYDMIGNINEFTRDVYATLTPSVEPILDPESTGAGSSWVFHGGAYNELVGLMYSWQAGGFGSKSVNCGGRFGWTLP